MDSESSEEIPMLFRFLSRAGVRHVTIMYRRCSEDGCIDRHVLGIVGGHVIVYHRATSTHYAERGKGEMAGRRLVPHYFSDDEYQ